MQARHSVHHKKKFRIFSSDLDYSIIVPSDLSSELYARLRHCYDFWHRVFPFLGEIEIYTQKEFRLQQNLQKEIGTLLVLLRLLRKWRWQFEAFKISNDTYHREKARRSMQHIFSELTDHYSEGLHAKNRRSGFELVLGETLFSAVEEKLREFWRGRGIHMEQWGSDFYGYSPYLQWWIKQHCGDLMSFELRLTPEAARFLFAILPDDPVPLFRESHSELTDISMSSGLSHIRAALAAHEFLTNRSFGRIVDQPPPTLLPWIEHLRCIVRTHDHHLGLTLDSTVECD